MLTNRRTFIGALLWLVPLVASGQDTPSAPLKVLFIGNSYTSVNDLPAMVAALADAAGGRKIEADRHLVGGCTLEKHVKDQKAIDKIRATEVGRGGVAGAKPAARHRPEIDARIRPPPGCGDQAARRKDRFLSDLGTAAHSRHAGRGRSCHSRPNTPRRCTRSAAQRRPPTSMTWCQQQKAGLEGGLNGAYLDIAHELGAKVAPVGIAWKKALAADPSFVLHRPDKSHPNPTGTYLAACVFYATLLDKSPVGLPGKIEARRQGAGQHSR